MYNDSVGVMPTDTLYGLVGSALPKKAVERIYKLKGRRPDKPLIILISSFKDLELFGVKLNEKQKKALKKLWPGKVSVILPILRKQQSKFNYLTRGSDSLAFRLPAKKSLNQILKKTEPLVAPSANPEGKKPAQTIAEAKKYFGTCLPAGRQKIDFYIDGGKLKSKPSTLVLLKEDYLKILRKGAGKLPKKLF